ncbi:L-2-amino-thiazoline-4-carboxylic acid hydrolase [Mycolicibacterium mucogenicum]|uniref:L-2-amino-thiazoline-4-carboxylic acid hydrolase n=1 Tax=Mycolicibacterium mucogenicum TaxID=56689 RepID=UPI0009F6F3EE|nr:L-2-amino-thiazoline-4-carboxylic acid hydrolase [Mycolicibacterium mucogenicum]
MDLVGKAWEAAWRGQYLKHFRKEVQEILPQAAADVSQRVQSQASEIYRRRRRESPDPQGLMVISACALILASYRELQRNGLSNDAAFEVVRRSFSSIFGPQARMTVRVLVHFLPDPVGTMRKRSIAPFFRTVFGRLFTFEERRTPNSFVLVIPRCGIYDFFSQEGEPNLTRAFCAWDRNWLGVLDASDRPVATRRSLTLVTDQRPCEFHFDPAPAGPAPTVDVTR